ncbi:hypothetical protein ACTMTI_29360 [Nonomuraea sp. H19]
MPGHDFPGDPDHYLHRDEVVSYLRRYADTRHGDPHRHARQRGGS